MFRVWLLNRLFGIEFVAFQGVYGHESKLVRRINGKRFVLVYGTFYDLDSTTREWFFLTPEVK